MDESSKLLLTVAIPTITVLVGILVNNRQLDGLRREMDSLRLEIRDKFSSLEAVMNARFETAREGLLRVEGVLDARLKHLEDDR